MKAAERLAQRPGLISVQLPSPMSSQNSNERETKNPDQYTKSTSHITNSSSEPTNTVNQSQLFPAHKGQSFYKRSQSVQNLA